MVYWTGDDRQVVKEWSKYAEVVHSSAELCLQTLGVSPAEGTVLKRAGLVECTNVVLEVPLASSRLGAGQHVPGDEGNFTRSSFLNEAVKLLEQTLAVTGKSSDYAGFDAAKTVECLSALPVLLPVKPEKENAVFAHARGSWHAGEVEVVRIVELGVVHGVVVAEVTAFMHHQRTRLVA